MNDLVAQARKRYLAANPPRMTSFPAETADGSPVASITLPNIDDFQIIGAKIGMEYLAVCHDEDAVEELISTAIGVAKQPELVGVLLANVLRGVNVVVGEIISKAGLRDQMQQLALEAWAMDFSDIEAPE